MNPLPTRIKNRIFCYSSLKTNFPIFKMNQLPARIENRKLYSMLKINVPTTQKCIQN